MGRLRRASAGQRPAVTYPTRAARRGQSRQPVHSRRLLAMTRPAC